MATHSNVFLTYFSLAAATAVALEEGQYAVCLVSDVARVMEKLHQLNDVTNIF